MLVHFAKSGHFFTVRSQSLRRTLSGRRKAWVKETLRKEPVLGEFLLDLPETEARPARRAKIVVRSKHVTLRLRDCWKTKSIDLPINVVLAKN